MTSITIVLEGEPRGKGRPRHGRGFTYTPASTRAYETALATVAKIEMMGKVLLEGPLRIDYLANMPIPTSWSEKKRQNAIRGELRPTGKPDIDNCLKLCMDALNGIVYRDDAFIVDSNASKRYSVSPALIVTISSL